MTIKKAATVLCVAMATGAQLHALTPASGINAGNPTAAITGGTATSAAASDSSRVYDLDEVVIVSHPKDILRLRRQPLSSTILTGEDLASTGIRDLNGLSAYVPSFAMPAYGSRLTSAIYVRGIGSRVNNPAVGIYLDGIPLVSKNSYNMHLYQIDRADVLRGPQGTLYGMNTEGGLIRLHSKNPMNHQGTEVSLGLGTKFYRNIEAAHYHKFNDKTAFSVAAFYNGQNGFMRNATTGERADKSNEAGARTRIIYKPGTRLTTDFTADYQYALQNAFAYGIYNPDSHHISAPAANRSNTYKRNMLNTGLNLTYKLDNASISSQTSYQFLDDCMNMDQDYLPEDFMHLCQRQLLNVITQEFTIKGKTGSAWQHTSGLYGSYQWLKTEAPVYFDNDFTGRISSGIQSAMYSSILKAMADKMIAAGMPPAMAESAAAAAIEKAGGINVGVNMAVPALFHTPQANIGIFHETSLTLTPSLQATIGLRYDYSRVSVDYETSAAMTVNASVMGQQAANTLSSALARNTNNGYSQLLPKIGLNLTVDDAGSNVYAVVSKGYRAGGYNIQMFSDILQSELMANADKAMTGSYEISHTADDYKRVNSTITYKPEVSWNYEVGAHLNLFDGMMHADLSTYCMLIRNQQLSVMAGTYGFGRMMVNAGRSRSLGVEAALRGSAWDDRLSWSATYSFTNAEFTHYTETDSEGQTISYEGKHIPFVPSHTLGARADLRLPLNTNATHALLLGADVAAQGRIYWDEVNSTSQPFYALLGLHAGIQWDKISLNIWSRNTTNTRYATFAFSSEASGKKQWFAQRGTPIQAGFDINIKL